MSESSCPPWAGRTMLICDSPVVTPSMFAAGSFCSCGTVIFGFHIRLIIFSILLLLSLASRSLLIWRRACVSGGCAARSLLVLSRRSVARSLLSPAAGGGRTWAALSCVLPKSLLNLWMACFVVSLVSSCSMFVGLHPVSGGFSFLDSPCCPPLGCMLLPWFSSFVLAAFAASCVVCAPLFPFFFFFVGLPGWGFSCPFLLDFSILAGWVVGRGAAALAECAASVVSTLFSLRLFRPRLPGQPAWEMLLMQPVGSGLGLPLPVLRLYFFPVSFCVVSPFFSGWASAGSFRWAPPCRFCICCSCLLLSSFVFFCLLGAPSGGVSSSPLGSPFSLLCLGSSSRVFR